MRRILFSILAMLVVFLLAAPAHAFLINRGTDTSGNRLIYDPDLKITWYDYTNSATSWSNQVAWAGGLSVDFGGTIYDDWRLPITDPSVSGYNQTGSEMGHLFYTEMENMAGLGLSNTGDFQNLISDYYWSGTEYATSSSTAWYFGFNDGYQSTDYKAYNGYALAVRSGDVAAVPEPATVALLGIGLAGMGVYGVRRRRRSAGNRQWQ